MKKIILSAIFLVLVFTSFADNFQLTYREGIYQYSVSYSPFKIFDSRGRQVAQGYSDKYGRIIVNLPAGNYVCEVIYRNTAFRKQIIIDGATTLKEVLIR